MRDTMKSSSAAKHFSRRRLCNGIAIFILALMMQALLISHALASPITLNIIDGDVRAVLMSIARMGGIGLVLDDSVSGKITISLNEIEPENAFRLIAASKGLHINQENGVAVITSGKVRNTGMYRSYVFPIEYADLATVREAVALTLWHNDDLGDRAAAKNIRGTATAANNDDETEDSRLIVDMGTNSLVLFGTAKEAEDARKIISSIDRPTKQVSLEAKVVAIQKDAAKELGIEWSWSSVPQYPDYRVEYDTRRQTITNPDGSQSTVTTDTPRIEVERHYGDGNVPGIIQFGKGPEGHPFEFYYSAKINALITDGKAKILARPNITTLQGREAVINIGGEVPVPTVSVTGSTTTTSITYREAGIILRCTPRVNPDGAITALVHTEVSSPLYVEDMKTYRFQKRAADTAVRLKDGETMVIGGLIGSEESKVLSKVPLLGDLPILGAFFRSLKTSKTDSEIMIFLTAHVLD